MKAKKNIIAFGEFVKIALIRIGDHFASSGYLRQARQTWERAGIWWDKIKPGVSVV